MKKPHKIYVTIQFPVEIDDFDDDVDWTDPDKVIRDQYECCGFLSVFNSPDYGKIITVDSFDEKGGKIQ